MGSALLLKISPQANDLRLWGTPKKTIRYDLRT